MGVDKVADISERSPPRVSCLGSAGGLLLSCRDCGT
jgi:hypothetical protein